MTRASVLLLSCICCWTGICVLIYVASTIVQWFVFANGRAEGIACQGTGDLSAIALVGAILSTLATLFKIIAAFCSCCCFGNKTKPKLCCIILLQLLQLFFKFLSSIFTTIVIANRASKTPCDNETTPDPRDQSYWITVGSCLELVGFFLAFMLQCPNMCYLCKQMKRTKLDQRRHEDAGEYAPLLNNEDGEQK